MATRRFRYISEALHLCGVIILLLQRKQTCSKMKIKDSSAVKQTEGFKIQLEEKKIGHRSEAFKETGIHIAVGGGIISKGVDGLTPETLDKLDFFNTFLPSFCETITNEYHFHFYWGYDFNDPFFSDKLNQTAFVKHTDEIVRKKCPSGVKVPVVFVLCDYTGSPAWAQNDAMFAAYLDGADYFYRINDDSTLITKKWANSFIENLQKRDPPNIGVVGPLSQNDYAPILSYDFVHKTHLDMLGVYYPRVFDKWWADSWITVFYRKEHKMVKLQNVTLIHEKKVERYKHDAAKGYLKGVDINCFTSILKRYVARIGSKALADVVKSSKKNKQVISFSLFGNKLKYTTGAIRNAQLAPVIFKGWTTRFYTPPKPSSLSVPENVISKLLELGAEVITVSDTQFQQQQNWRYLVAYDANVDTFLIRNVDSRLSDREKEAVDLWLNAKDFKPVNVLKELPEPANSSAGLWGADRKSLASSITETTSSLGARFRDMIRKDGTKQLDEFVYAEFGERMSCFALDKQVSDQTCELVKLKTHLGTKCGDGRIGQTYEVFDLPTSNHEHPCSLCYLQHH